MAIWSIRVAPATESWTEAAVTRTVSRSPRGVDHDAAFAADDLLGGVEALVGRPDVAGGLDALASITPLEGSAVRPSCVRTGRCSSPQICVKISSSRQRRK